MEIIINAVSNLIISISGILFLIFVYKSDKIYTLPKFEQLFIKVGLAVLVCGSMLNFLTLSTPEFSEIVLNIGLAIILVWGAHFHYKHYPMKDKK
jgi:hypothetical protein